MGKTKTIKKDANQCSCETRQKDENTFVKISDVFNNETVLVKKKNSATGNSLWYYNTYAHQKSCASQSTVKSAMLTWRKLSNYEKEVYFF